MQTTFNLPESAKLHHATRGKAEKLAQMLAAEYPALTLAASLNEDASRVTGWTVTAKDEDGETTEVYEGDKVPEIADLLEACADLGIDPEEGAEEEGDKPSGSVVPEHYRQQYREMSSNGQTCGDWLAEWLVGETHGIDGFNVEEFTAIMSANGVDMSKPWARLPESGQKGWIGRYRMNGRQVLEKVVALNSRVVNGRGDDAEIPAEALAHLRGKHAKWIAKQEKLTKALLNIEDKPEAETEAA